MATSKKPKNSPRKVKVHNVGNRLALAAFVLFFAAIGGYFVLLSRAATPLAWAPPTLTNPVTWTPTASSRKLVAGVNQDVRIVMPSVPVDWANGIEINGGRNIVLIGGAFNFSKDYATTGNDEGVSNRMIYIKGNSAQTQARTVHIEGVRGTGNYIFEGINIDSQSEPALTVQIQNFRIDHLKWVVGNPTHYGGDALQPWNGPTTLRLDRFTVAEADYQSIFLQSDKFGTSPKGLRDFRNVNLRGGTEHTYLLTGDTNFTKSTNNVYVKASSKQPASKPYVGSAWAAYVKTTDPPGGDFVTINDAGMGYKSPGYANGAVANQPPSTPTPPPTTPTTPSVPTPPTTPTVPTTPTSPTPIVTPPSSDGTVSGTVTVQVPQTSTSTVKTELFVDGSLKKTVTDGDVTSFDTAGLENGNHTVTVRATDVNGVITESSTEIEVSNSLWQQFIAQATSSKGKVIIGSLTAASLIAALFIFNLPPVRWLKRSV